MLRFFRPGLIALLLCLGTTASATAPSPRLEQGYRDMYNLDFATAHEIFLGWQVAHPEDPLGFVSDAAAYLFSEFDRLHVLQTQLFTNDRSFEKRSKLPIPPRKPRSTGHLPRQINWSRRSSRARRKIAMRCSLKFSPTGCGAIMPR